MKKILYICDRCGKILTDYNRFYITAFYNEKEDGTFFYCSDCYSFMTNLLNQNTEENYGDRERRLQNFIDAYQNKFGVDNGE